ncbi:PREDICTED: uncharacterized protein LOC105566333 [Vollenhovia emeryi]|uniref:uncharacterized protein LOC105566333 n=1 Tax=Vollenhovia emeryi TaxID=411798 RepID=UPI0005F42814|nr:PREDICTED: uncharacterized protein LOC105566333 [Vollenhovia emeryi]
MSTAERGIYVIGRVNWHCQLQSNVERRIANTYRNVVENPKIMRQIILVFNLFIAFACVMGLNDDITDKIADSLSMSKTDVEICMNKTNVNINDLMKMDQLVDDDIMTADVEKSALKVGCLFVCLLQKMDLMSGTYINVEKIKNILDSKMRPNHRLIAMRNQILDTCSNRVKSKVDECEVTLKFYLCIIAEVKRKENWRLM